MTRSLLRPSTFSIPCALLLLSAAAAAAQVTPATPATPTTPAQLAGQWRLNKELSTLGQTPAEPPGDTGSSSGGRTGRTPRSGGSGGRGGAGARGGARGSRQVSSDDLLTMREVMRTLREAPAVLNIVVSPTEVSTTDDQGIVRKFRTDGKKESLTFGTAKVDATSKWDGAILEQEITAGRIKVSETYQLTTQGHMLVVTILPPAAGGQSGGGTPIAATPMKFIYDRVE